MPGDSEHPVTVLGDLRLVTEPPSCVCGGIHHFRPATVADLVSALRAEGVLVWQPNEGNVIEVRPGPLTTRSRVTRPTLTGGYPEPEDRAALMHKEWAWCGYHKSHPMVSYDPCGDPYCWEGFWYGEVDACGTEPPIWVHVAPPDNSFNFDYRAEAQPFPPAGG